MNEQPKIILYGLGGAEKQYQVLAYWAIYKDDISTDNIKYQAYKLAERNPSIKMIFQVDNRPGLKSEYVRSYKEHSIESCAIFKDLLERGGIRLKIDRSIEGYL